MIACTMSLKYPVSIKYSKLNTIRAFLYCFQKDPLSMYLIEKELRKTILPLTQILLPMISSYAVQSVYSSISASCSVLRSVIVKLGRNQLRPPIIPSGIYYVFVMYIAQSQTLGEIENYFIYISLYSFFKRSNCVVYVLHITCSVLRLFDGDLASVNYSPQASLLHMCMCRAGFKGYPLVRLGRQWSFSSICIFLPVNENPNPGAAVKGFCRCG